MKRCAQGFSMVEVLVALFVLSIGLLGLAGMQVSGLRNNQSAYFRSQATELAYYMADSMRANAQGLTSYDGQGKTTDDAPADTTCAETAVCDNPAAVAAYDLAQWRQAMQNALPVGRAWICVDASPDDGASAASPACDGTGKVYAVKIWWDDDRTGSPDKRLVMSFWP
jgi:type IV pilus assembly protein PilV